MTRRWRSVAPVVALAPSVAAAQAPQPLRVGTITIERADIYSAEEASRGLLSPAAALRTEWQHGIRRLGTFRVIGDIFNTVNQTRALVCRVTLAGENLGVPLTLNFARNLRLGFV